MKNEILVPGYNYSNKPPVAAKMRHLRSRALLHSRRLLPGSTPASSYIPQLSLIALQNLLSTPLAN